MVIWRQSLEHLRSCRCGHADAAKGNMHGFEVLTMGLVDAAVQALLSAKPPQRTGAHGDPDVRGDDRGRTPRLVGSVLHPLARHGRLGGQHPVEQHAIGDCATESAKPRSHGGNEDARPPGRSCRSSATARCTRSIGACSCPAPIPTQSFDGASPRRPMSAAIATGGCRSRGRIPTPSSSRGAAAANCASVSRPAAAGSSFDHSEWYPSRSQCTARSRASPPSRPAVTPTPRRTGVGMSIAASPILAWATTRASIPQWHADEPSRGHGRYLP